MLRPLRQPTGGRARTCGALLACLALFSVQAPAFAATAIDEVPSETSAAYWPSRLERSPGLRRVVAALRALRDPNAPRGPETVELLATDARAHLEELFVILHDGSVPALEEGAPQPLSEAQLEFTLALFAATDRRAVLAQLETFLQLAGEQRTAPSVARVALRALGAVGRSGDLEELFEHAVAEELDRATELALRTALVAMLERDPSSYDWLDRKRSSLKRGTKPALVLALGDAGDARALPLLVQLAQSDRELVVTCLSQISALGPSESREENELVRRTLCAQYLDSDQPMVLRAAMLALGRLHDAAAVPRMVAALEDPARGTVQDAAAALRHASGLALEGSAAAWHAWHESELEWFEREGREQLAALSSDELFEVVDAVRALSQRRLHRLHIAEAFEACLFDPRPEVRRDACTGLAELGTRESAPALRAALEDLEPEVRAAAERALQAVSAP